MTLAAGPLVPNAWSQTTTNWSGFLPLEFTLDAPQREQQIDLIVRDRLPFDACENHLKLRSDMLSCIRGKRRRCGFLVRTSLVTHEPTYPYSGTNG